MQTLTPEEYYSDKTFITNSMLSDFVSYENWSRIITPESYYAKHIAKTVKFEATDDMLCWTIADRYFAEWPHILAEYPKVSKRSWENPNEITGSMLDKVMWFIQTFKAFKTFNDIINQPDTIRWESKLSIRTKEITLKSWRTVPMKWKFDFINDVKKMSTDQKTTGNVKTYRKDIQWKWVCNIYNRNIRQQVLYHMLTGYTTSLSVGDDNTWMLFIPITDEVIKRTWAIIDQDLEELMTYYDNNWTNLAKDVFAPFPTDAEMKEIF